MIEVVFNALFHWLFTAPLLYRPIDWVMCISQVILFKQSYDTIKYLTKKNKRKG